MPAVAPARGLMRGVARLLSLGLLLGSLTSNVAAQEESPILSPYSARADCIVRYESRWDANAVNRSSGAAGLGQFLYSTWLTTPYAAYSRFDPWANHAAVCWMLEVGRAREFVPVQRGLC